MQFTEKKHNTARTSVESCQIHLFDRVIEKSSPKVREVNNRVLARISHTDQIQQVAKEFEERRRLNEREEDEEREIWYEILDKEQMAQELAGIADTWFLEWALAVYKDEIQSDALREAHAEYEVQLEWEAECEFDDEVFK